MVRRAKSPDFSILSEFSAGTGGTALDPKIQDTEIRGVVTEILRHVVAAKEATKRARAVIRRVEA